MPNTNRVSVLFRSAFHIEKGAEVRRRACIAATIVGTYANKIFGDHLFGPLAKQVAFDRTAQKEQLTQFLYKNFDTSNNHYDDEESQAVLLRMNEVTCVRTEGE